MRRLYFALAALVFIGGASLTSLILFSPAHRGETALASLEEASFYVSSVQPIFTQRCVACHSCNTAPCQLNLTNYEGATRGANKTPINQPYNQSSSPLTRLGIDAHGDREWRTRGFFSVIEHTENQSPSLARALQLKFDHPKVVPVVRAEYARTCPTGEKEWDRFAEAHADSGMPYGLPALTQKQFAVINEWLAKGAPGPNESELRKFSTASSSAGAAAIRDFEAFLNQPSNEAKIVSRYLYEHLYLAHLHFARQMPREFFRLVRSRTSCESNVDEIASRRPYDDPGKTLFYCFKKFDQAVTEKNHMVYELSSAKLARWNELFFAKPWSASQVPSYDPVASSNPFLTFKDLPADSRYQWLLDDSQYTVKTFIKGNVCRGSTAVNVIDEQFNILFLDPKSDHFVQNKRYAEHVTPLLRLPGAYGSDVKVLKLSTKILPFLRSALKNKRNDYREERDKQYLADRPNGYSLTDIWDGDRTNPNAVLTVFRHYDSAQVLKGAWGGIPKTAWVLDYPLFERIVYDLVAGYDNNGSMSHQVLTRVYMHYIRMEAEENFLNFLPRESRIPMRNFWYRDAPDMNKRYPLNAGTHVLSPTSVVYRTHVSEQSPAAWNSLKSEFFDQLKVGRLTANALGTIDTFNLGSSTRANIEPISSNVQTFEAFENEFRKLVLYPSNRLPFSLYLDDTALIKLIDSASGAARVYTLVRNKEHFNIASILGERGPS